MISIAQFVFACSFFVLEPISPKFSNFSNNLIQIWVKNKHFGNMKPGSRDMTIFGEWFGKFCINAHNF